MLPHLIDPDDDEDFDEAHIDADELQAEAEDRAEREIARQEAAAERRLGGY